MQDTLWPRRDVAAFRYHVARLVEIKPSRLDLREGHHADAMTLIEARRVEGGENGDTRIMVSDSQIAF